MFESPGEKVWSKNVWSVPVSDLRGSGFDLPGGFWGSTPPPVYNRNENEIFDVK